MTKRKSLEKLSDILSQLVDETDGETTVTLGDLVDALHTRSYGPLLLLPAFIAASPVGAIPGMSIVTGTAIFLISVQMLAGRRHPWLPRRLLAFSFDQAKLARGVEKIMPSVRRVERLVTHRLAFLTRPPVTRLVALLCIGLGCLFYPLALIPFAVALPACGVLVMSLGLTARDGILVLVGGALGAVSAWLTWMFWPF